MLKNLKKHLTNNRINIVKISSGTLAGQIINFITLPILTRIYGAEIIGIWAILNSSSMIVKSISDLGLMNSLMTEEEEKVDKTYEIISLISLSISLIAAFGFAIYFFITKGIAGISFQFLIVYISFEFFFNSTNSVVIYIS